MRSTVNWAAFRFFITVCHIKADSVYVWFFEHLYGASYSRLLGFLFTPRGERVFVHSLQHDTNMLISSVL